MNTCDNNCHLTENKVRFSTKLRIMNLCEELLPLAREVVLTHNDYH